MSAPIVQSCHPDLDALGARFAQEGEQVQRLTRQVTQHAEVLRAGGWEGRGKAAFLAEVDGEVTPALLRLSAALAQAGQATTQIRLLILAAEEEAAAPFRKTGADADPEDSWEGQKLAYLGDDAEELSPLDTIQTVMDVAGFIPGVGDVIDLVNGGIYAARGDWTNAGLSLIAVIPVIGSLAAAGRLGAKGPKVLRSLGRLLGLSDEAAAVGKGAKNFASSEKLVSHFAKHGPKMGFKSIDEYLGGARSLINQNQSVAKFVRQNGDTLYYNRATNEFAVMSQDGYLRTYFKPKQGAKYWDGQISKP
jgi:WXG100 family type VII secretion target